MASYFCWVENSRFIIIFFQHFKGAFLFCYGVTYSSVENCRKTKCQSDCCTFEGNINLVFFFLPHLLTSMIFLFVFQ